MASVILHNIQSPEVAHDKQAQANAEHVREPTTKAKTRRAQNGTLNYVFPIFRAAHTGYPIQFHAVGSVICGRSGQFYFQIDGHQSLFLIYRMQNESENKLTLLIRRGHLQLKFPNFERC